MNRPAPSMAEAVHLFPGWTSLPGAKHRVWLQDSVWLGPASVDPARHGELRRAAMTRFEQALSANAPRDRRFARRQRELPESLKSVVLTADDLMQRLEAFPSSLPIVVWTSPAWTDRVNFWWMCDALRRADVDSERIYLSLPTLSEKERRIFVERLGGFNEPELVEALSQATPLTRTLLDDSVNLWLAYAGSDPREFDRLRRVPSEALPRTCEPYRYGFPIRDADGRLRLSAFDQRLLSFFREDEWRRPVDLLIAASMNDPILLPYRDAYIAYRLQVWREHSSDVPRIVSEFRPDGVNGFTRVAYRLTNEGARALAEGIDSLSDAPPMEIGGCIAYVDPYVVEAEDADWRIAKL